MNEVTRIHLGRQPFTISIDAHKALKAYLAEIEKHVADKEVANEVELRMAELLTENGITGDKTILPADVDLLKQQLGDPADFSGDEETTAPQTADEQAPRRLFRDTDNAILAGVAAGLANYFGLDVVLVRLLFVVLAIFGGGIGIVLYIVLWLAVPPATTTSEKLQMQGKSVTLGALKDSVSRADLPGAAKRANGTLMSVIDKLFRVAVKLLGVGFIVAGLAMVFGLAVTKVYMLLHHGKLFQENLFPVGLREQWLVVAAMALGVIVATFLVLIGVATFKRKWPLRGWVTGVFVGLFAIGSGATLALSADIAPRVEQRYQQSLHTTAVRNIQPFNKIVNSGELDLSYTSAPTYAVSLRYVDHPDLSKIKITVKNNTLYIDSSQFDANRHCTMLCIFPKYNMVVQIAAPNIEKFQTPPNTDIFFPERPTIMD